MVPGSVVEADVPAVRFGHYIDELQDFFAGRGVRFGSPGDLSRLAERLSSPSFFHDEMASMVRAIIYREAEGVSREELLELVAVATGGPYIDLTAPELQPALEQLLTFFSSVLRSLWKSFPAEVEPAPEPDTAPEPPPLVASSAVPALAQNTPLVEPVLAASNAAPPAPLTLAQLQPENEAAAEIAARARAALDRAALDRAALDRTAEVKKTPEPLNFRPLAPATSPVILASPSRRSRTPLWIAGFCGILLGLFAGLFFRFHPALLDLPNLKPAQQQDADRSSAAPTRSPADLPIRDTSVPATIATRRPDQPRAVAQRPRVAVTKPPTPRPYLPPYRSQLPPVTPTGASSAIQPPPRTELAAQSASLPATAYPPTQETFPAADPKPLRSIPGQSEPLVRVAPAFSETRPSVFLASSGVMASNLLFAPAPQYPSEALAAGMEGRVVLQALVWRDGTVAAVHVLRGDHVLGAAAEDAVRRWRYRPYVVDGRPSDVATFITVDFHIHP